MYFDNVALQRNTRLGLVDLPTVRETIGIPASAASSNKLLTIMPIITDNVPSRIEPTIQEPVENSILLKPQAEIQKDVVVFSATPERLKVGQSEQQEAQLEQSSFDIAATLKKWGIPAFAAFMIFK